jgi:quinoprotein glucose dehydrogenase
VALSKLGIKEAGPLLLESVADKQRSAAARVEALKALEGLNDERLLRALHMALADDAATLRTAGRRILARHRPAEAVPVLAAVLRQDASVSERQGALAILGDLQEAAADAVLSQWLDQLLAGQVPVEIQLDLLEAAGRRSSAAIKQKLARYEAARPKDDPLANYRETLAGGDAEAGRKLYYHKAEVSCLRCHKVGSDGGEVGPDLTKIGSQQQREYLLEALVAPNRQIAKGFETLVVAMSNGQIYSGVVKADDGKHLHLITAEGKLLTLVKTEIEDRKAGKSAMPEDLVKFLSKSELRDLVEFLANLK